MLNRCRFWEACGKYSSSDCCSPRSYKWFTIWIPSQSTLVVLSSKRTYSWFETLTSSNLSPWKISITFQRTQNSFRPGPGASLLEEPLFSARRKMEETCWHRPSRPAGWSPCSCWCVIVTNSTGIILLPCLPINQLWNWKMHSPNTPTMWSLLARSALRQLNEESEKYVLRVR